MQRWNLHRRVAVMVIARLGARPPRIVGGFLLASSLVSMWVSNTATALMMLPIALSVVQLLPPGDRSREQRDFSCAVLLAVAYGATAGGLATLIGTPPNALLAAYMTDIYGVTIGFGQWMLLGVPAMLVTLPAMYMVLTRGLFALGRSELPGMARLIQHERASQGQLTRGEIAVAMVFAATALGWMFQPAIARLVPLVTDTTIAMTGALMLFVIPVRARHGEFVMTWEATRGLPWGVLLLFGGGLSLAGAIEKHGVATYLGSLAGALGDVPTIVLLAAFVFGLVILGELASNTATAATFLPVASALALSVGENPLLFLVPAVLAASCSFMLPVGTPPNAIVYASGFVPFHRMVRAGLLLDILMVPIMLGLMLLLGRAVFGIEDGVVPVWVK
jgi:sodium-dependent dicarboxylate transporter 2/3/5